MCGKFRPGFSGPNSLIQRFSVNVLLSKGFIKRYFTEFMGRWRPVFSFSCLLYATISISHTCFTWLPGYLNIGLGQYFYRPKLIRFNENWLNYPLLCVYLSQQQSTIFLLPQERRKWTWMQMMYIFGSFLIIKNKFICRISNNYLF